MSVAFAEPRYTPRGRTFTREQWDKAHGVYMEDEVTPRCSAASAMFAASKIVMTPSFAEDGSLKAFMGHKDPGAAHEASLAYLKGFFGELSFDDVSASLHDWLYAHFEHNVTSNSGLQALVSVLVYEADWHGHMQQMQNAGNN